MPISEPTSSSPCKARVWAACQSSGTFLWTDRSQCPEHPLKPWKCFWGTFLSPPACWCQMVADVLDLGHTFLDMMLGHLGNSASMVSSLSVVFSYSPTTPWTITLSWTAIKMNKKSCVVHPWITISIVMMIDFLTLTSVLHVLDLSQSQTGWPWEAINRTQMMTTTHPTPISRSLATAQTISIF